MVVLQRYVYLVLLPVIVFSCLATLITNEVEIQILNSVRFSLSVGVLFAYLPAIIGILHDPRPLRQSDFLSFGIVYSWLGAAGSGLWWIGFQLAGRPNGWFNTDFVAGTIFLSCMGALFHFAAPGAIEGRVPPRQQLKIGALVTAGVLLALLIFDATDLQMKVAGFVAPVAANAAQRLWLHDWSPPHS